jgi:hypothetical protein
MCGTFTYGYCVADCTISVSFIIKASATGKMEAVSSCETSVAMYDITLHHSQKIILYTVIRNISLCLSSSRCFPLSLTNA